MSTPEDKIRDLKAKIAAYEQEYVTAAPGSEDKRGLRAISTESNRTLNILLQQQSQPQAQGE
jgi:hypothetical protein